MLYHVSVMIPPGTANKIKRNIKGGFTWKNITFHTESHFMYNIFLTISNTHSEKKKYAFNGDIIKLIFKFTVITMNKFGLRIQITERRGSLN